MAAGSPAKAAPAEVHATRLAALAVLAAAGAVAASAAIAESAAMVAAAAVATMVVLVLRCLLPPAHPSSSAGCRTGLQPLAALN